MECIRPTYLHKQDITVPCGKCAFCGATKRSDWSLRLHYESKLHAAKAFVTLTYADAHLVWKHGKPQLVKKHLQDFFKRVRKAGYKLRYYAVGEYGSHTYRPHYHLLLFGDVPEDVIRDKWKFGHVHIGKVTQSSVMYCLKYMITSKAWQMVTHRERPFTLMSRRPGLGANYLTKAMVEWHKSGRKNYAVLDGVKRHLPRYYKQKIFSKVDLVRISVRDQKKKFQDMVSWLRSPAIRRMKDPLGYRALQLRMMEQRIKLKSKENLKI